MKKIELRETIQYYPQQPDSQIFKSTAMPKHNSSKIIIDSDQWLQ